MFSPITYTLKNTSLHNLKGIETILISNPISLSLSQCSIPLVNIVTSCSNTIKEKKLLVTCNGQFYMSTWLGYGARLNTSLDIAGKVARYSVDVANIHNQVTFYLSIF